MKTSEAIEILYENLGEPTDMYPYSDDEYGTIDTTTRGYSRLLSLLNNGQVACANHKINQSNQVRFQNLVASTVVTVKNLTIPFSFIQNNLYEITVAKAALPHPTVEEPSNYGRFDNSRLKIGDDYFDVDFNWYDPLTELWHIQVAQPLTVNSESNNTFTWYKKSFFFLPPTHAWVGENFVSPLVKGNKMSTGNMVMVLKVLDLNNQVRLGLGNVGEDFLFTADETGEPTKYIVLGSEIRFDVMAEAGLRYGIDYYRNPTAVNGVDDEFELPEQFHYGIILWATWQGLLRAHEHEMAYVARNAWMDFMKVTKNDNDYRWERTAYGQGSIGEQ